MNAACRWAKRGMKSASNFFSFLFLFPRLLRVGRPGQREWVGSAHLLGTDVWVFWPVLVCGTAALRVSVRVCGGKSRKVWSGLLYALMCLCARRGTECNR